MLGGRAIGKIVSPAYLLHDGGTEYEWHPDRVRKAAITRSGFQGWRMWT
ncbi:hypothetical protein AB4305_19500 [Nocardia sp. 2YAB30]